LLRIGILVVGAGHCPALDSPKRGRGDPALTSKNYLRNSKIKLDCKLEFKRE
jgi:hypothetical protein